MHEDIIDRLKHMERTALDNRDRYTAEFAYRTHKMLQSYYDQQRVSLRQVKALSDKLEKIKRIINFEPVAKDNKFGSDVGARELKSSILRKIEDLYEHE